MTVIKIILFVIGVYILIRIVVNLYVAFNKQAAQYLFEKRKEEGYDYVRREGMVSFLFDLIWLYVIVKLLIMTFSNSLTITIDGTAL